MIAIFMAVALVFTMMPLANGSAFADDSDSGDDSNRIVFTIVDKDGSEKTFTRSQMESDVKKVESVADSGIDTVTGGFVVKNLLKNYDENAVATVTTVDNYDSVKASGKTVKELREGNYILAYKENEKTLWGSDVLSKDKTINYGKGDFYLFSGTGERDKWVNKIVLSEGGNTPDPVVEMADLTIKGDALVKEMEFSIKDLKNMTGIQKYESLDYPSLNSYGTEEVSKVDGV